MKLGLGLGVRRSDRIAVCERPARMNAALRCGLRMKKPTNNTSAPGVTGNMRDKNIPSLFFNMSVATDDKTINALVKR
jgi:hypothetical protein